ncbi:MAG TPA: DUF1761 domain-containing protein [Marinilabiliales bacterium]|nr:MAG: hypothetical protein A2W95_13820 [Bacteroidetes bacterium GWA2_40_14]OFX58669.1 MAG: hypothetical protein A2W84_12815 [Bacteroidetes bacterium GWC2_40_13]OFX76250.1 MAG: hypothetical protein A2W96_03410 [Bacteroidetes bacterium GWD2_40_43]OFX95491.1 MAG: hypothetical protein A2W97_11650 [Bacteroidetes bacterium GWE2_40_63]OFY19936.1 MAG: hypothetical protein A2W88_04810 [Bacteroidetes bacterium GWF2_40_13]OFZ23924.1 MAG: hypothetical protein A2437_10315 [Bacteroidetes bacterium RIFOXYC
MMYAMNLWAVLVSAVLAFGIGSIWYGPLFGKAWQKEVGLSDEKIQSGNMIKIFGISFILTLIMAFGMAFLFHKVEDAKVTWLVGLTHGLYIGVAFVVTSMGVNYQYEGKSLKLWAINSGYQVLFLMLMGAILGAWH